MSFGCPFSHWSVGVNEGHFTVDLDVIDMSLAENTGHTFLVSHEQFQSIESKTCYYMDEMLGSKFLVDSIDS